MPNIIYNNKVLADKATELLNTKVNTRNLLTVDTELAENAGMTKTINTYTYNGKVEAVSERQGNTDVGSLSYVGKDYTVQMLQQHADYTDEDVMKDNKIVEILMDGATTTMVNKLNRDFYTILATDENIPSREFGTTNKLSYSTVVDAIADMNIEDETQLFLIVSPRGKASIRTSSEFVNARAGEIVYSGMIGSIAGIPVIVSKYLTEQEDVAYLMTKEATTLFIKQEVEVEQDRDADKRINDVYLRSAYVMAITNASKAIKIGKAQSTDATITTATKGAKSIAGGAQSGAKVYVYINGVLDGAVEASSSAYSYTAKANLVAGDKVKVVAVLAGYANKVANTTVAS